MKPIPGTITDPQALRKALAQKPVWSTISVPIPPAEAGDWVEFEIELPPLRHPNSQRFHDLLEECGELHDQKQADYGRDHDPFSNVRGSTDWGMPAWVGAMVRATDKVRRLQTYARKGELQNEAVQDAFLDLAVYALIALVLWEQEGVS